MRQVPNVGRLILGERRRRRRRRRKTTAVRHCNRGDPKTLTDLPVDSQLLHVVSANATLVVVLTTTVAEHSVGGKCLLLCGEEPRALWLSGKPEEGEDGQCDGAGTLDDEEVLPRVKGAFDLEEAISDDSREGAGDGVCALYDR